MQAKCRGVRPSLFVFSVSALPYWVLKSLEWVEAWFLSTNCLSFDWWIFDLVTFKNYKRETYLHKQNRCYFRPVVQSSNMEGCVVALRVRFISQFWAFCCNFICCTRKTTAFILTSWWRHYPKPYLVWRNTFSMTFNLSQMISKSIL